MGMCYTITGWPVCMPAAACKVIGLLPTFYVYIFHINNYLFRKFFATGCCKHGITFTSILSFIFTYSCISLYCVLLYFNPVKAPLDRCLWKVLFNYILFYLQQPINYVHCFITDSIFSLLYFINIITITEALKLIILNKLTFEMCEVTGCAFLFSVCLELSAYCQSARNPVTPTAWGRYKTPPRSALRRLGGMRNE